ncbi:MAG: acyl carrier protein [Synergistaceae bacterium]|nr:acyl carrier protein [Synergistaceae bacterium]
MKETEDANGIKDKIIETIRTILPEATAETSMRNTPSWDSLKTLQIVMALDEDDIAIPFERIADIRSVADILAIAAS